MSTPEPRPSREPVVPSLSYADALPVACGGQVRLRDLLALTKPRLSMLVFFTTGVGLWCAPGALAASTTAARQGPSAAVVAAANTLNSYIERHSDALMQRTRNRPLPAGRLDPKLALGLGTGLGLGATAVLYGTGGPTCALLSFVAFLSYVGIYTPMKRYSWVAVVVGAVPGAIPPMMGWAASAGRLDAGAWALFVLMFCWQMPHFFAIALYLADDYARGGHVVLPLVVGARRTRQWMVATAALLLPCTLLPYWVGTAGTGYAAVALSTGGFFLGMVWRGAGRFSPAPWARQVFAASVLHLTALFAALLLNKVPT